VFVKREEFTSFWELYRQRPFTGRNQILASVCPQVYGLYVVKLAVALVLIGGVQVTFCPTDNSFLLVLLVPVCFQKLNSGIEYDSFGKCHVLALSCWVWSV